jgi:hypothetical protein
MVFISEHVDINLGEWAFQVLKPARKSPHFLPAWKNIYPFTIDEAFTFFLFIHKTHTPRKAPCA